jgi:hypothetical protein
LQQQILFPFPSEISAPLFSSSIWFYMAITIHRMELNYLVYLRCLNNFRKDFPTSRQERESHEYLSANIFACTAPTFSRPQCFRLLFARKLKTAVLSAPVENEKTLNQHIYVVCQTISKSPVTFEVVRQSLIRIVCLCFDWDGVYFERLFWIWLDKQ